MKRQSEYREFQPVRREFLKAAGAAAGLYLSAAHATAAAPSPENKPESSNKKIVWICTDMEGLAGIDQFAQCMDPDESPKYQHGREQLTADANAAVAGCFDAGATKVYVIDGHGRNHHRGFIREKFDRRAALLDENSKEDIDESAAAMMMIGQHAMASTLHAFLDHTQKAKEICRFLINGVDHGEMSQCAMYAGAFGVPLVYVSGDEALCAEARRLFPNVISTPTKRGIGWNQCELYPVEKVRAAIRRDAALALRNADRSKAWRVKTPIEITVEWAWSGGADPFEGMPGVTRLNARTIRWNINDPREVYAWPHK
jgi:D-amino peptidase